MANKTTLASWLYSNRLVLNPQFREFSWPERHIPGLFDFSTSIEWNGTKAEGRGVDINRDIALEKSVAEAIERLICMSLNFDSVGFAVAGSIDPTPHARFEVLERHFLKKHIEYKIPLHQIVSGDCEFALELFSQFKLRNRDLRVDFHRMSTPNNLFGVVCSISIEASSMFAFGFALSDNLKLSLDRSFLEALPNYAWIAERGIDLSSSIVPTPWHIDSKFVDLLKPLLVDSVQVEPTFFVQDLPILEKIVVPISDLPILKYAPLSCARFIINDARVTP